MNMCYQFKIGIDHEYSMMLNSNINIFNTCTLLRVMEIDKGQQ